MGKSQREKGRRAEIEVLKLLGEELGQALTRNLEQTRGGGADCLSVWGFAIEVKRQEALSRPKWWKQACKQAQRTGNEPLLLYRRSREAWKAWIHTRDGMWREGSLIDAACAIREKWAMRP